MKILYIISIITICIFLSYTPCKASTDLRLISHDNNSLTIEYNPYFPKTTQIEINGIKGDKITIPSAGLINAIGKPQLPVRGTFIAILPYQDVVIKNISYESEIINGNYYIHPVPKLIAGDDDVNIEYIYEEDQEVYNLNDPFPPEIVKLGIKAKMRGQDIQQLLIYPLQYLPESKRLVFYKKITIEIKLIEERRVKIEDRSQETEARRKKKEKTREEQSDIFRDIFKDIVINY